MKRLSSGRGLSVTRLFVIGALVTMTLAGLLLIVMGLAIITGHWQHYEDGSGVIGGDMVRVEYCVPTAICADN